MLRADDDEETFKDIAKNMVVSFLTGLVVAFGEKFGEEIAEWTAKRLQKRYDPPEKDGSKESKED